MRFTKLQLENWRNFAHVDVALQNRMFLIGANATGKSNLLDVFRFLRDIVRVGGGFEKALADRDGVNSLRNIFANTSDNVVMDVSMGDNEAELWRYRLSIGQDGYGSPLLLEEPELSLHPEIVRHIPALMATIQKEHSRQILMSTHSDALLRDESIALDEVLILQPASNGTTVDLGHNVLIVKQLLDAGLSIAEAALPITQPEDAYKLSFPGEP